MRYRYVHGDANAICDRSSFKVKKSQTLKEWNGLIVRDPEDWEARHPQDYVRGRKDPQSVREPRPEPASAFLQTSGNGLLLEGDMQLGGGDVLVLEGDMQSASDLTVADTLLLEGDMKDDL